MKENRGFTLIELLITVTIIAILVTVGIISYVAFLRQTRDVRRQSDLKTIQSVLEQYHADQHFYPPSQITFTGQRFTNPDVTKVYLNQTPKEQWQSSSPYVYVPNGTDYCLYALLEGTSPGLSGCPTQAGYNYAVSQP